MTDLASEADRLLAMARDRGRDTLGDRLIPPGLDHFTAYVGLLGRAFELAKLIKTEKRDLEVIRSHYTLEAERIAGVFREVEIAMLATFERDQTAQAKTFDAITMLISAGQYEIASEFHRRLLEGFQRSPLDSIIDLYNGQTSYAKIRLR